MYPNKKMYLNKIMNYNRWTVALAAAGLVTLPSLSRAEDQTNSMAMAAMPMAMSVQTALSSTTLSGYVDTSMIWEPGTSSANIPGRAFDGPGSKQDGFNLDVVSLTISKPPDETPWAAGYVAQLWFGPDMVGFNTSSPNLAAAGGDAGVKQAFVELHAPIGNGLDIKIGHFNYIGGYEVPEAGSNPNFSRSFAWTQEPASHTGMLLTYKVANWLTLMGGIANTYNNGVNWRAVRANGTAAGASSETEKTYMGQFMLTAPDNWGFLKGSTLAATVVNGLNNASGNAGSTPTTGHITCLNVSATTPTPFKGLTIGGSYDYMDGLNLPFAAPGTSTESKFVNVGTLYLMYQATEKLKLAGRAEYVGASDGVWYASTGHSSELLGLTGTVDYSLWKNVISRAEVRWDHSLTGDKPYGGTVAAPGGQKNVVTLALNIIYNF
jgi:hypothetical protein